MADASRGHDTTSAHDPDAILPCDGAASTHVQTSGSVAEASTPADLPLRQSLRKPQSALEPKIHDITEKFTRACNALDVGQLVKDEYFTLFESIGAIEIMDPKMDSGFLEPGDTLEDDFDTLTPLLPEELISVMDHLLCYEMAWHTGYPLSQTLFTSVYIDKLLWPETRNLEQAQFYRGEVLGEKRPGPLLQVLRAYCLALIKGCDFAIAKITGRDYFEEEDFCTHTYNRVLFVSTPMDVFLRELDAAMEIMEELDFQLSNAYKSAIMARLDSRKCFLRALDLDVPLDQISHSWHWVLEGISSLKNTHQLGRVVPGAFSTKMQRRLASTVPPRPIVELEFMDAVAKLTQLATDCQEATRFVDLPHDPLQYESFLWHFASRSPAPLPYSRQYLATLLFHPDVLNPSVSLPLADATTLVFPASPVLDPINWTMSPPRNPMLPKPPRVQFAMLIDEFVDRCGQPYMDLWVALCQNRCRLRRMLTHVIIGWDMLQSDASLVDTDLQSAAEMLGMSEEVMQFSLSTWVYHKKLWMMEKIILLGFEQDIYLPDEFAGLYLFLSLIATRRKELLARIGSFFIDRGEHFLHSRRFREAQDVDDATPYINSLINEAEGIAALSQALARLYTILLYLGLISIPKRPFSSESLRYELRMKPFLTLQPPEVPPFEDFKAHTQPYGPYADPEPGFQNDVRDTKSDLWSQVENNLKNAKEAFASFKKLGAAAAKAEGVEKAWNKDVQNQLASCIALGVAVSSVQSAVTKEGGNAEHLGIRIEIPESGVGKRYAEGWVVVKVGKE